MGAIARQGPHQVAQKSTRTGLSDFKTSWSKFASVTSTIPLPAIWVLLVVNVGLPADAHRLRCRAAICISASRKGAEPIIVTLPLDACGDRKVASFPAVRDELFFSVRAGLSSGGEGLDKPNQLPALEFRKLGPDRHAVADHAVRQQPEERAGELPVAPHRRAGSGLSCCPRPSPRGIQRNAWQIACHPPPRHRNRLLKDCGDRPLSWEPGQHGQLSEPDLADRTGALAGHAGGMHGDRAPTPGWNLEPQLWAARLRSLRRARRSAAQPETGGRQGCGRLTKTGHFTCYEKWTF